MLDFREIEFFDKITNMLPLYETLKAQLEARYPGTTFTVQKTQIAFRINGRPYCRIWLPTFRRIQGYPKPYITITLGLRRRLDSPRVAQAVEPYPDRWTHHIPVFSDSDLNAEFFEWIDEALAMLSIK